MIDPIQMSIRYVALVIMCSCVRSVGAKVENIGVGRDRCP